MERNFKCLAAVSLAASALLALAGCNIATNPSAEAALADSASGDDWAGYGRTNGQQHFSPLETINRDNAAQLGLAWSIDLPQATTMAQPIEVGDVLYFATGLSIIHAVDARSGKELWSYDPKVGEVGGLNMRVGWGVRGIAWSDGKIFTGTQDGRLIALDSGTGELLWSAQTIQPTDPAHVNGAPRVFGDKVLIGFAGTTGIMRGYVSAYDIDTGKLAWRFYTVPGNPADGFENEAMEMAAKTWSGKWWEMGGGAMVWNSMAYDPETGTAFIGTGSPYPWNHRIRSENKGDNLFIDSIVALDIETGKYKWHYQTVPGDTWDLDAIQDIELADVVIDGKPRKVLMQAPKNGFFYVIDRITGEFISAEPIVEVTWASHIDKKTGRPVERPGARYQDGKPVLIAPSSAGAHNWMPMAYSPQTELAYIPSTHFPAYYSEIDYEWKEPGHRKVDGGVNILGGPAFGTDPATGKLIAWSPALQKEVWSKPYPTHLNGGVLATAGNLVFQGSLDGILRAFAADTGELVWQYDAKAPILATPITYRAGGKQYITVLTGSGMGIAMYAPTMHGDDIERFRVDPQSQDRRVLTFAIGGTKQLPPRSKPAAPPPDPDFAYDASRMGTGYLAYSQHCLNCHGDRAIGMGSAPDLRRSATVQDKDAFEQIVRGGLLEPRGMPKYGEFDDRKLEHIRHFIRARASQLRGDGKAGDAGIKGSGGAW